MTIRVAINGYGRIGKNILRALYENAYRQDIEIVAINGLSKSEIQAHLTRYDSIHGKFNGTVDLEGEYLVVNGDPIQILREPQPSELPWKELKVDVVCECTGAFTSKEKSKAHLIAGAKKVLISAPAKDADLTVVYGVNHHTIHHSHTIISNASCTTNCLATLAKPLQTHLGIKSGLMTTVHAYTNDQVLIDAPHLDLRRARSATQSMIPTKTGAASALGLVIPDLAGKLDGLAVRVPTPNVSLVDLTFIPERKTSKEEVNHFLKEAGETDLKNILVYSEEPLVSIDWNHHPASSIVDATQTKVMLGDLVKVLAWYDNEWGFSNRMLDVVRVMMAK